MKTSYIYDTYLSNSNNISHSSILPNIQMYALINYAIKSKSYGLSINLTRNATY